MIWRKVMQVIIFYLPMFKFIIHFDLIGKLQSTFLCPYICHINSNMINYGRNFLNQWFFHIYIGTYVCIASSKLTGPATASGVLKVVTKPLKIESIPSTVCGVKDKNISIKCIASGIPLPDITWTKVMGVRYFQKWY